MENNKKKIAIGVIIAALVLGWFMFKPAPAEAIEISPYGSLNYRLGNDEDSTGKSVMKAEDNGSSIGVEFRDELTDGYEGFAKIEVGVDTDDSGSNPFDSKLAYAGIDMEDSGVLSAGRQDSVFKTNVTSITDIFPEYGGKAAQKLSSRDSHTFQYSNSFGALTVDNQVKVDGSTGKDGVDVWETGATMDLAGGKVGVGYSDDKVNLVQHYGAGITMELSDETSVGYNYTKKDYEAASSTDVQAHEVVLSHSMDDTTLMLGYGEVKDGTAYTTAGVTHEVTENFSMYAGYEFADKTGSQIDTTGMSAGLKFKF